MIWCQRRYSFLALQCKIKWAKSRDFSPQAAVLLPFLAPTCVISIATKQFLVWLYIFIKANTFSSAYCLSSLYIYAVTPLAMMN